MIRRLLISLSTVLLTVSTILVFGATPASAGMSYKYFDSDKRADVYARVGNNAYTTGVYGAVDYFSSYPQSTSLTVYVLQCDGLGHNCGTIAANSTQQQGATHLQTSTKPYSPGHVYKTCASVTDTDGWRLVNGCTSFAY